MFLFRAGRQNPDSDQSWLDGEALALNRENPEPGPGWYLLTFPAARRVEVLLRGVQSGPGSRLDVGDV